MTSYTRKLYAADPKAFEAFEQSQRFEHRHTYGKTPTLVQFTPAFSKRTMAVQGAPVRSSFGLRKEAPTRLRQPCLVGCGDPACDDVCKLVPDALKDGWRNGGSR